MDRSLTTQMNEKKTYKDFKRNNSKGIILSIFLIVSINVFFFLSPVIFHKRSEVSFTQLKVEEEITDTLSVVIEDWKYSKSQNLMEVQLSVNNTDLYLKNNDIKFSSACNFIEESKGTKGLRSKVILNEINTIVLWIYDIPTDYNTCVLFCTVGNKEPVSLYTNCGKVNVVKNISKQSQENYRIERLEYEITRKEKRINNYKKKINEYLLEIEKINEKIDEKRQEEIYESESNIKKIENDIYSLKNDINNKQTYIDEYNEKISVLQSNIKEYKNLINKIRKRQN